MRKILWFFAFIYMIIIFLPKTEMYYQLESYLKQNQIVFNDESTRDILGVFSVKNARVFYEKLEVGKIDSMNFYPFIFYNKFSINKASFNNSLKQFVPKNIENISFSNTIFYPIKIWISGNGDFGDLSGEIDLNKRKISIRLKPAANFLSKYSDIARNFTKDKDQYIYEKNY